MIDHIYGAVFAACVRSGRALPDMLVTMGSLVFNAGDLHDQYQELSANTNDNIDRNLVRGLITGLLPFYSDAMTIDAVRKAHPEHTLYDLTASRMLAWIINSIIHGWPARNLAPVGKQENPIGGAYRSSVIDIVFAAMDTTMYGMDKADADAIEAEINIIRQRLQQRFPTSETEVTVSPDVQVDTNIMVEGIPNGTTAELSPAMANLYGGILGVILFIQSMKDEMDPSVVMDTEALNDPQVNPWLAAAIIGSITGYSRLYTKSPFFENNSHLTNVARLFTTMLSGMARRTKIGEVVIAGMVGTRYVHPTGEPEPAGRWTAHAMGANPMAEVARLRRVTYIECSIDGHPYRFATAELFAKWCQPSIELSDVSLKRLNDVDGRHAVLGKKQPSKNFLSAMPPA